MKKTRTRYINIDARFSEYEYFPFSDYYITLPEEICNVKSLQVVNIEIPVTFYNISSILDNNYFQVSSKDDEPGTIVTIPDNHYDSKSIHKAITDAIQDKQIDLHFQYDQTIGFLSDSKDYRIDFAIDKDGKNDKYNMKSKLGWTLGFRNESYYVDAKRQPDENKKDAEKNKDTEILCNMLNPRYVFLEIKEYEKNKEDYNNHAFTSSMLCPRISKHIISRITMEYRTFPYGAVLPANLYNGLLVSDTRLYTKPLTLYDFHVRLLNEFGFPINLNGYEISFCIQLEEEYGEDEKNEQKTKN